MARDRSPIVIALSLCVGHASFACSGSSDAIATTVERDAETTSGSDGGAADAPSTLEARNDSGEAAMSEAGVLLKATLPGGFGSYLDCIHPTRKGQHEIRRMMWKVLTGQDGPP